MTTSMARCWNDIADTFRRRIRRIIGVRGLAWVGLVVIGSLWAYGLVDWSLQLDNSWVRLVIAIGILAAMAATVWRTILRPLTTRLSDVDIARTIEQGDPRWGERLSSAAQFRTAHRDQRLGSRDLQQEVIADVETHLADIDVERVFDVQRTKRLAWSAAVVCFAGIVGALWQHAAAATALSRIAMPFANITWPRTTELQFLDADLRRLDDAALRTATGEPLPLYLENRLGTLPEDVVLVLQLPDGRREERPLQSTVLRDESGTSHEVGIATLTAHHGPVHFRAVGGDDRAMPWRTLEVVSAPAVSRLTITVTPPDYTAQQPRTVNGAGAVEALVGSRVHFEGETNTPLESAALRREGHPPQAMTLSDEHRRIEAEFLIEEPGRAWYWFDVADAHGLAPSNPPRYELRGIADRKPTVFIDQPTGDVTVTPDADLPLRIMARDDQGIKELHLVHSRPDKSPVRVPLEMSGVLPTDETVEQVWSLAPLGLNAGDRITYHAEAIDAYDLPVTSAPDGRQLPDVPGGEADFNGRPPGTAGQVGISAHRHIDILSTEQKRRELATRQLKILDTLQASQERQSRALESTAGLRIQAELADRLQSDDLDLLKQTEIEQQNIRKPLDDAQSGAATEVDNLQQELARNHIDDPQFAGRLDQLAADLKALTQQLLPTAEQSLARARKLAQPSQEDRGSDSGSEVGADDASEARQQLRRAEQAQSAAVGLLNAATSELGSWRRQYEMTSELDDLIVDQTDIQRQTQDVGSETLTKRPDALTPQQQADLARLSDRQRRLASRLEELIKAGTQAPPETADDSPQMEAMREALRRLAQRQTAAHMHGAAESLKRNDIAQTAQTQQQVISDLRDFGERLHSGDESAAETLLSTLEEQSEEVETLRKRQKTLARSARQAMSPTADPDRRQQLERLMKEQEQLAQRGEELARQLRRQQNRQSAQSAARAARRMREAQQGIEREQPEKTAASQQEALDDLAQLADELAQRRREVEQQLAREQVDQLAGELQAAADRQEALIATTVDLDEQQRQRGSWSRSLRKELRETTGEQTALADRLDELRGTLSEYPVIDVALEQAAAPMKLAADRMEQSEVSAGTVDQQRTAHQRLLAMVAVAQESDESNHQTASPSGRPQNAEAGQQDQQAPQLLGTQLRLLRQLQTDVQTRTAALTGQVRNRDADADAIAAERESLARDQGRIADLTRVLLEQFAERSGGVGEEHSQPQEQP